jgi:hypothetical protein
MAIEIVDAILALNPEAQVSVVDNDVNQIQWHDGTPEISAEDINAKLAVLETEKANAEAAKETAKAAGNQKLLDLGLTQEEASALTGYIPQ